MLTICNWFLSGIAGTCLGIAIHTMLIAFVPLPLLMQSPNYEPGLKGVAWLTIAIFITWETVSLKLGPTISGLLGIVAVLVSVSSFFLDAIGFSQALILSYAIAAAFLGLIALETIGAVPITALKAITRPIAVNIGIAINAISTISAIYFIDMQRQFFRLNGLADIAMHLAIFGIPTFTALFSALVSHHVFNNTDRRPWLRRLTIAWAATGGTNFQGADLTDANFSNATVPNTNFKAANLTRTYWHHARHLKLAQVEKTYLADSLIQQLVNTGSSEGQSFDYQDLRGVNLQNAQLADTSFIGTNLSQANLTGANLSRAKLVRTQLYRANLSNAVLTGAYIQDWGISTDTQFDGIQCDYVYMRLPTPTDPDPCRKPDNRNETFAVGDFANFIAPIIKTLDLYSQQNVDPRNVAEAYKTIDLFHHEGIDPGAAAIALQQLAEQHPEAGIEVVALEGRGQDQIRLQAIVSSQANRSELSAQYSENYRQLKALPYGDLQALLSGIADKDQQLRRLETMLEQAIQQPRFYVETYRHQGELIMSQSKGNINIDSVQGNISGVAAAGEHLEMTGSVLGNISSTVTNTIDQLSPSPDPDQPGLKELLTQLQAAIESESQLNNEDKAEALEQVKVLAEAGQHPEDSTLKKAARTAIKILKGTAAALPSATDLVKESNKLLTAIATLLALA